MAEAAPTGAASGGDDLVALLRELGVRVEHGLSADEAARRLRDDGPNELPSPPRPGWPARLAGQFGDFMIQVLLVAALIALLAGETVDAVTILVIVVLNAGLGFLHEWRADRALQALRSLAPPRATVLRDGRAHGIDARELVRGDVVRVEAGDQVPADLRLCEARGLRVDESLLSGESVSASKDAHAPPAQAQAAGLPGDMLFQGTLVTAGRGVGVVVAVAARTRLGSLAGLMRAQGVRATPLQRRLAAFGRRLSWAILGIAAVLFVAGVAQGESWSLMALTAISLAVAGIPEALPAVITMLLALGARGMARQHALVRTLPAVEALGSVTVICSDKTGTLTVNRMSVQQGTTWGRLAPRELWSAAALCNDATHGQLPGQWLGDPTETALVERAQAEGIDVARLRAGRARRGELGFDPARKRMSTLHDRAGEPGMVALTKGAPEVVLARCVGVRTARGVDAGLLHEAGRQAQAMAERGMRVLAVAERRWPGGTARPAPDELDRQLELIGLVGLIDPPRPQAAEAVAQCRAAGIRVLMITGDHPATAVAIARSLGIAAPGDAAATGAELAALDDAGVERLVARVAVYARMDPAQKIRIVQALQHAGHVVAMTGDGVNDAPALRGADVGVAMGLGGTEVARQAAGLVLLDDNFATIVAAVREGRRIYDNIRKFVRYALAGNAGEIGALALAPLFGLPVALLPAQILWVNLVTDGLPGLMLAGQRAERDVMRLPPRAPGQGVLDGGLWQHALLVGLLICALCLGLQAWSAATAAAAGQTMVFTALTFTQLAHVLAIRSQRDAGFGRAWRDNPPLLGAVALTVVLQLGVVYWAPLQRVFHTRALSASELAACGACALLVATVVEVDKAWRRRRGAGD